MLLYAPESTADRLLADKWSFFARIVGWHRILGQAPRRLSENGDRSENPTD